MTPPPEAMRERQLEGFFLERVRQLGGRAIKLAPVERGCPDRLVIWPGGAMRLVELKTETGTLEPAQVLWHQRVSELGVTVHVLHGQTGIRRWLRQEFEDLYYSGRRRRYRPLSEEN